MSLIGNIGLLDKFYYHNITLDMTNNPIYAPVILTVVAIYDDDMFEFLVGKSSHRAKSKITEFNDCLYVGMYSLTRY